MIEIAFDTDKQTLQEQIDSGEKLKPADVKGGYGSYNYWLERQSLVYELKQLCQGKINDLVKELDVSPEDEQAIQDKAQQLAQEKAKNSLSPDTLARSLLISTNKYPVVGSLVSCCALCQSPL